MSNKEIVYSQEDGSVSVSPYVGRISGEPRVRVSVDSGGNYAATSYNLAEVDTLIAALTKARDAAAALVKKEG